MALSGSLIDFPLDAVLRLLETSHKSGFLEVSADGEVGALEVTEGRLTGARLGDDAGEGALGAIFGMGDGTFIFRTGAPGPANLTGSLDEMITRAAEESRRIQAIRRAIPSNRMRFALSDRALAGNGVTITPDQWRILLRIDGTRDVNTLADSFQQGRLEMLHKLHELVELGLIDALEPAPEASLPRPAGHPPRWEAAGTTHPPVTHQPASTAPASEPVPQPRSSREAQSAPPAPQPSAQAVPPPETEDLSLLLKTRLSALEHPVTPPPAAPPTRPQDFWERQSASPTPAPPIAEPTRPSSEADDRLAALFGRATTIDPTTMQPVIDRPKPSVEPALREEPAASAPATSAQQASAPDAPISHWLPPDTTAPILETEVPSPAKEERRRGLFGFGRKKVEAVPTVSGGPMPGSASGRLASFANALLTEYNSGLYGKARLDERMHVRLRLVDEQADPLDRMLAVQDDRLDVVAIDRDFAPQQAGPYLATLVRQIFEDAERVFGRDKARKGYRAAVKNALGGDEGVLHELTVAPNLPKL